MARDNIDLKLVGDERHLRGDLAVTFQLFSRCTKPGLESLINLFATLSKVMESCLRLSYIFLLLLLEAKRCPPFKVSRTRFSALS